jgi:hypothetical protein
VRHATQRAFEHLRAPVTLQSLSSTHVMQLPLPLQTPPVHAMCAALAVVPQRAVPAAQVAVRQVLLGAGQSLAAVHCTHSPAPVHLGVVPVHSVRVSV